MVVAMLDILGFRDLVNNNSLDWLKTHQGHIRVYLQLWLSKLKAKPNSMGGVSPDLSGCPISSVIMSDSIVFWCQHDSPETWREMLISVRNFISQCHTMSGVNLRGGITYGEFHYNNNGAVKGVGGESYHSIMGGKALVELYELEQSLDEACCVLTPGLVSKLNSLDASIIEDLKNSNVLVPYDFHTKTGTTNMLGVNWVRDKSPREEILNGFSAHNKSMESESAKIKRDNTLQFFDHVSKNSLFVDFSITQSF